MQIILFTYSCILMKTIENENNRGYNNGCVPHGQYLTISALSVVAVNAFLDRSINFLSVSYTVHIRFVRYIYPLLVRQCLLVDCSLFVPCPVRMRYSCVLCAPTTFIATETTFTTG